MYTISVRTNKKSEIRISNDVLFELFCINSEKAKFFVGIDLISPSLFRINSKEPALLDLRKMSLMSNDIEIISLIEIIALSLSLFEEKIEIAFNVY